MNVLRGVSCGLALFCMVGLAASFSGCSKKSPNKTATPDDNSKSPDVKPDKQLGGDDNSKKQNVAVNSGSQRSLDGGTLPVKAIKPGQAKSSVKAKSTDIDPQPANNKESGSSTKRGLRGPKLGSGR